MQQFGTYEEALRYVEIDRLDIRHNLGLYNAVFKRDIIGIINFVKKDLSASTRLAEAFNTITDFIFLFNTADILWANLDEFERKMFWQSLDDERKAILIAVLEGTEAARIFARDKLRERNSKNGSSPVAAPTVPRTSAGETLDSFIKRVKATGDWCSPTPEPKDFSLDTPEEIELSQQLKQMTLVEREEYFIGLMGRDYSNAIPLQLFMMLRKRYAQGGYNNILVACLDEITGAAKWRLSGIEDPYICNHHFRSVLAYIKLFQQRLQTIEAGTEGERQKYEDILKVARELKVFLRELHLSSMDNEKSAASPVEASMYPYWRQREWKWGVPDMSVLEKARYLFPPKDISIQEIWDKLKNLKIGGGYEDTVKWVSEVIKAYYYIDPNNIASLFLYSAGNHYQLSQILAVVLDDLLADMFNYCAQEEVIEKNPNMFQSDFRTIIANISITWCLLAVKKLGFSQYLTDETIGLILVGAWRESF